ncbi:L-rhamnose mutarotase [Paenibacillus sp. FSL R7-0273]|uniref:L-rhamnose mutarotase n=1 Tax=Paenibacillus sp. FSL R7-0273 TaxID=1536772 RepID=UPI0004F638D0|nr:L-rhamnose mutarotase [Paenibacillus sp. FSL R7-0273]AIQ46614.1 L-rhamnose mutarotase [Paenibacillus sp. FSL R7-0273]OMF97614.1 L-rhamnose mutarotase [Paenibacillus sp. FSL R7-0273]
MIRKASVMRVYPEHYEEYKRRHDELWPEMAEELRNHGSNNYSIFLDEETGNLFAYVEIEDEAKWDQMSETEICRKWWVYMEPLMETNPDNSPVSKSLKEVFYLK